MNVKNPQIGIMSPLLYHTNKTQNNGQLVTHLVIDALVRNCFVTAGLDNVTPREPNRSAKSVRDGIKNVLDGSDIRFKSSNMDNTLKILRCRFRQ